MFDLSKYNELRENHLKCLAAKNYKGAKHYIDSIRHYLDSVGLYAPKPKYAYKEDDIRTWKFVEGIHVYKHKTKAFHYLEVENPDFIYGDL